MHAYTMCYRANEEILHLIDAFHVCHKQTRVLGHGVHARAPRSSSSLSLTTPGTMTKVTRHLRRHIDAVARQLSSRDPEGHAG